MVTREQLKKLAEPFDYKYRLQSAKYGKATIVSYVDSRQVQQRFDDVCGIENWQNDYKIIDGSLFGGVSILVAREDSGEWITKWDVGSESNIEKEKGNSSDSFKRSAVMWGVGRFLYSLGIITLKAVKHTNDKEYPATDEGKILWNTEDLTEYCKKVVASGELDRTKSNVKPLDGAKTTTVKPVEQVTPTKPTVTAITPNSGAMQPSKTFDDKKPVDADKVNALTALKKLEQPALLKFLIKDGYKVTSAEQFVENNTIEVIREVYTKFTK